MLPAEAFANSVHAVHSQISGHWHQALTQNTLVSGKETEYGSKAKTAPLDTKLAKAIVVAEFNLNCTLPEALPFDRTFTSEFAIPY